MSQSTPTAERAVIGEPRILITGSEGVVGRRLRAVFPNAYGLDIASSADVRADLLDYPDLPDCDVIIHLACATKNPTAPFEEQAPNLHMAEVVVLTSISRGVPVVFASSVWAQVHPLNAYACMKRCVEQMVDSHGGASIRLGWIGHTPETLAEADTFLRSVAWSDEQLHAEFLNAVDQVNRSGRAAEASDELRSACREQLERWRHG